MWATFFNRKPPPFPPPPHDRDKVGILENMRSELALSGDQSAKLAKILEEHFEEMRPLGDTIEFYKRQLVEESLMGEPDSIKINELSFKIGQSQAGIERHMSDHFNNISKICNPAQLLKLKNLFSRIGPKSPGHEPPHQR